MTAVAGLAFVLLSAAAAVVAGEPGAAREVADYYDDENKRVVTAVCLQGLALAFFVWFLSGLAWALHSGGSPLRARVAYGAGLVATALLAQSAAVTGALAYRATDAVELAETLHDIALVSQNTAAFPIAALVAAASPRWAGPILAMVFLVDGLTFAGEGFFAPDGAYSGVAFILLLTWVAWRSAALLPSQPPS